MSGIHINSVRLTTTYIRLRDGPDAVEVPVGKDFRAQIAGRTDLHEGRLVMVGGQSANWTTRSPRLQIA